MKPLRRRHAPPTAGEQVLLISPSGQLGNAAVLTGPFSDSVPADGNHAGLHGRTYSDGTVIEYDSVVLRPYRPEPTPKR
ncbi:phage baseplate assembly protein V [Pseudomonas sp. KCJK8993]|uniref:phage baseplate assembly protein V n=1 Tax=Pseudomonas sp. KCJK8993 TaxID=3344565 RepID=UPI003906135B